jgi:hypothetical protein
MTFPVIAAIEAGGDGGEAVARGYAGPPDTTLDVGTLAAAVERAGGRAATEALLRREADAALRVVGALGIAPEHVVGFEGYARLASVRDS